MKRLHVLQIGKFYPPYRGGMETHLQSLCESLQAHVDLTVLVANDAPGTVEEVVNGVPVKRLRTAVKAAGASFCPELIGAIRASRADLVHLHVPNPAAVLAYLVSRAELPMVVTYHSDVIRQKFLARGFDPIQDRLFRKCHAIIAASPNYLESSPTLRRHRSRLRVVPLAIRNEHFEAADAAAVRSVREQYGSPLLMAAGRMVYYKGFEYLIEAMREIPARLLLIGEGPLKDQLQKQAKSLGLEERIFFLGNVSDAMVRVCYHAADLFVLPSVERSEAFGIVQAEAMAAGTPVVNTNLDSGVPFVSPHGVSGLTVPPADSAALAAAIRQLLENPTERRRLGDGARARASAEFRESTMTERILEIYRSAAGIGNGSLDQKRGPELLKAV
jgi:rhamnosyl/mannosyltransferase